MNGKVARRLRKMAALVEKHPLTDLYGRTRKGVVVNAGRTVYKKIKELHKEGKVVREIEEM